MHQKTVTDQITNQEMAFAHLLLSGVMNDRRAAKAVGFNPDTAACIKAKPRVRDYIIEQSRPVEEKQAEPETESPRQLNPVRDRVLARLWELTNLHPELTRGSIAAQVKAMAMIVAIECLLPDRRLSPSKTQPPIQTGIQPEQPTFYVSELRRQQQPTESPETAELIHPEDASSRTPQAGQPESQPTQARQALAPTPADPFTQHHALNRVPAATGVTFETFLSAGGSHSLPNTPRKGPFAR